VSAETASSIFFIRDSIKNSLQTHDAKSRRTLVSKQAVNILHILRNRTQRFDALLFVLLLACAPQPELNILILFTRIMAI
jgi:hypothetical protein